MNIKKLTTINYRLLTNLLIISILAQNFSFAQNWKPATAIIAFKIKHVAGATAEGSFKGFVGSVNFDPENLATASLKATIDATTFETGSNMRDKTVKGTDYFDVEKYPKISMVSTKIEKGTTPDSYIGTFDLTIKTTRKSVQFPFIFTKNGKEGQFKGSFQLNRIEYGVGGKSFLLNNTATIFITLNVVQ
jgi:polyisoprenoid-binding protein YceI